MFRVLGRFYIDFKSNTPGGWIFFNGVNEATSDTNTIHETYDEAVSQVADILRVHYGRYFLTIQQGKVTKSTDWNQVHHLHDGYD